jgi:hypothetical protein
MLPVNTPCKPSVFVLFVPVSQYFCQSKAKSVLDKTPCLSTRLLQSALVQKYALTGTKVQILTQGGGKLPVKTPCTRAASALAMRYTRTCASLSQYLRLCTSSASNVRTITTSCTRATSARSARNTVHTHTRTCAPLLRSEIPPRRRACPEQVLLYQ